MPRRLQVRIEGEPGSISLETFRTVIGNSSDILKDLDGAISSAPRGSLDWYVSEVSFGSLTVVVEAVPKTPGEDFSGPVVESFVDGLAQVQRDATTPPYFSDYDLRKAQGLARALKGDGAKSITFTDVEREVRVEVTPDISENLGQLVSVRHQETGSVEGRLEVISVHRNPRFTVYEAVNRRAVRCRFEPELLELVKQALGKRVIVSGVVHLNYVGEPLRVEIERLETLPDEADLPLPKDLRGMSTDFTGGKETGEYLRELRNG